jgi:diguanylate cyclase (GGDEF)-like protein
MPQVSRARPVGTFAARLALAVLLAACLGSALVALLADRLAAGAVQRETVVRVTAAADAVASQLAHPAAETTPGGPSTDQAPGNQAGPAQTRPAQTRPAQTVPEETSAPDTGPGTSTSADTAAPSAAAVRGSAGSGPASIASTEAELTRDLTERLATLDAEPEVLSMLVVDERSTVLVGLPGSTDPGARTPDISDAVRTAVSGVARTRQTVTTTGQDARLTVTVPLRLPDRAAALSVELDAGPAAARAAQLWRALGVALMLGAGATTGLVFVTGGWTLARRHERALLAAGSDDLTGLGSRRAFRRDLRVHVENAARHGLPLTLALIDVNGLESVNGTVGRRRGDALLVGVGSVLQRAAGPIGHPVLAYRIGGDAFALILPGTGQDDAFTLTDTLRRHIGLDAAPLTANVGLGVLDPLRCPDPETLLIAADAALFEARSLGGNRVVGAGDGGTGLRWVATSGAHDRLTP